MNKHTIVILDGYTANPGDLSWDVFAELGYVKVYDRTSADDVVERCAEADIILTNKVVFTQEVISQLPNLRYIGVLATGYNVVDIKAAARYGIIVTNIPAYSTDSVVQMTFAHILNITNSINYYATQNRGSRWSQSQDFCYWDSPISELKGKAFGIIGMGNIGMRVANVAMAMGMNVYAVSSKQQEELPYGIHKVTLDKLLEISDILSLHCPLSDDTREIINSNTLKQMKHGAVLINTGRGPLVNENDVAEALRTGALAAYGADVMCDEPPRADNPLLSLTNAFITPHIAWASIEARIRLISIAADNVRAFLSGKPINVVK